MKVAVFVYFDSCVLFSLGRNFWVCHLCVQFYYALRRIWRDGSFGYVGFGDNARTR